MSDEQANAIVLACMTDETRLTVNIQIKDAWLLLSGIQLATRHPELSVYMKDGLFESALKFQAAVEAVHPEAHEFIEMGWDKRFDGVDSLDEYDGLIPEAKEFDRAPFQYLQTDDDDFDDHEDDDYDDFDDDY